MSYKDHFSHQAKGYAHYRPHYPEALFSYLTSLCEHLETAWDCATGNGQAAIMLADYFKQVIATDASAAQIAYATPKPNISYRVMPSEKTDIATASIDLVTVATAYHWFDFSLFAQEVKRVLKPKGVIAVWAYDEPKINPQINQLIRHFRDDIVGKYWAPEVRFVHENYQTIPFPFTRIDTPDFNIQTSWNLKDMLGFLKTWSGVEKYIQEQKADPVIELTPEFSQLWGDPEKTRPVNFEIFLLVGKL